MRAAAYCRVGSMDDGQLELDHQLWLIRKYCHTNNMKLVCYYQDLGVSCNIPLEERPAGRQLVKDALSGRFDILLVFGVDRLGREPIATEETIRELNSYGIQFYSVSADQV
jgi:site-specific DNA recombinase